MTMSLIAVVAATTDDIHVPFWPWGLLIIAVGLYVVAVAALIAAGRREDARALAGFVPDCAILVGRLARDRRISRPRRALLWLLLAYLATPIDLVPDFLPVAGQLDDAVLLGVALRVLVRGGGEGLVREAWPGPETSLTLVLRAAGLQANGRGSPDRTTTL
jgi:uncharacterized membrane protein YkvA (DUF1232 family)